MNRRHFLAGAAAAASLNAIGCRDKQPDGTGLLTGINPGDPGGTPTGTPTGSAPATGRLPIPPLLPGTTVDGRRVFELVATAGSTEFFAGQPADTMGFNGPYLGPTLRARRGEAITIRVTNDLAEPTTTHFHGAHLPAHADGGPHQTIAPGATWESIWDVDQAAATIWYHAHPMGQTARQVYFGLAGLFLIDDDEVDALALPDRYGVDDLPLVIQDRRFDGAGQLEYALSMMDTMHGFQGDTIVVNGAVAPFVEVEAKLIRLRLLDGCNGRVLRLAWRDATALTLIGGDQSLLGAPLEVSELTLSPGERAEVVVDLTGRQGDTLILRDLDGVFDVLEVRVTLEPTATHTLPGALVAVPRLDPLAAVRTRPFVLQMTMQDFLINGESMDMMVINETVPVGDVEVWEVSNASNMDHNFHMHGTHFEVLDRDGAPPRPWESGLKDTVYVAPGSTVRLLVQHTDYTDASTPYMYHCHVLEHEDAGMMGQFVVV